MRILLTAGATREYLDDVRFLSNVSTGSTGAKLADALAARGHAVTLLHGEAAVLPRSLPASALHPFASTADLQTRLRNHLATGQLDAVIHCAAVADYRPETTHAGKLASDAPGLTLRLVPTPKLLPQLKACSPRPLRVIGFKLTSGAADSARAEAVAKLFASGQVDAVIHNDLADLAASGDARPFRAFLSTDQPPAELPGLPALADWLHGLLGVG